MGMNSLGIEHRPSAACVAFLAVLAHVTAMYVLVTGHARRFNLRKIFHVMAVEALERRMAAVDGKARVVVHKPDVPE